MRFRFAALLLLFPTLVQAWAQDRTPWPQANKVRNARSSIAAKRVFMRRIVPLAARHVKGV